MTRIRIKSSKLELMNKIRIKSSNLTFLLITLLPLVNMDISFWFIGSDSVFKAQTYMIPSFYVFYSVPKVIGEKEGNSLSDLQCSIKKG